MKLSEDGLARVAKECSVVLNDGEIVYTPIGEDQQNALRGFEFQASDFEGDHFNHKDKKVVLTVEEAKFISKLFPLAAI